MAKPNKNEVQKGTLYFKDKRLALAHWRKMAAACAASDEDGWSADLKKSGKGWVVTVYGPKD